MKKVNSCILSITALWALAAAKQTGLLRLDNKMDESYQMDWKVEYKVNGKSSTKSTEKYGPLRYRTIEIPAEVTEIQVTYTTYSKSGDKIKDFNLPVELPKEERLCKIFWVFGTASEPKPELVSGC